MGNNKNNSVFNYFLLLFLSSSLLLAQAGNLHIHLEHDGPDETSAHAVSAHPDSILHKSSLAHEHHADHSTDIVDVSPDTVLKNKNLLNALAVIFLLPGFLLYISRRMNISGLKFNKRFSPPCQYLFRPPMRAPPAI